MQSGIVKSFLFLFMVVAISGCGGSYESENRDLLVSSFQENFGFEPPKSITHIKMKNWALYDTSVHWMAFTHNQDVFNRILLKDRPLDVTNYGTHDFEHIVNEIKQSANNPDWLELPDANTHLIYFKKDFMNHTFSEYYLWTNNESGFTYLYVHYFD